MDKRIFFTAGIPLLAWILSASAPVLGDTISASYSFTGSAQNEVVANGFLTADGIASGSVDGWSMVAFDTQNNINLTTLQNYGTFTMIFPDGDTAFGNLYEDDVNVSLVTFSGPFTQMLTFIGGTGEFANISGSLNGGGFIYPASYTASGAGTLTAPGLVATPEPDSGLLLLIGLATATLGVGRRLGRAQITWATNPFTDLKNISAPLIPNHLARPRDLPKVRLSPPAC